MKDITSLRRMFEYCDKLKEITFTDCDFSKLQDKDEKNTNPKISKKSSKFVISYTSVHTIISIITIKI